MKGKRFLIHFVFMFAFVHSPFLRSKWCLICHPLQWRRWLLSALVMLRYSHQKKSRLVFNPCTDVHYFHMRILSNNPLLQPKEKNKAGDLLGATEKTSTDKKRERRNKKKVKRLKIKEKEKKQKLKEANKTEENKKPSKAQVTETLKKVTKGGKATILKVSAWSRVTLLLSVGSCHQPAQSPVRSTLEMFGSALKMHTGERNHYSYDTTKSKYH